MKNYFQKGKELWSNRRYRALLIMGIYLLFFILLFNLISFGGNTESKQETVSPSKEISLVNMDRYDFYMNIVYLGAADEPIKSFNIDGTRFKNKQHFTIRETEQTFYKEVNNYFTVTDQILPVETPLLVNFDGVEPSMIDTYLKKSTFISKTEYANKTVKEMYSMPIHDFALLYMGDIVVIPGNVILSTYKSKNQTERIELDLSMYNKIKIEISYKNINDVTSFDKKSLIKVVPGT